MRDVLVLRGARGAGGAGGGGDAHDRPIRHSWLFALRPASRVYASRSRKRPRRSRVNAGRVYPLYGYVIINIHRHRSECAIGIAIADRRRWGGADPDDRTWPGARRGAERRFELETGEFAPPEKARMQKAISVHQTCSLYPYTEMARARETNSTTSLPRGGTTTPLGASCAHSSALLSPSTACERRARPRTHGELRT